MARFAKFPGNRRDQLIVAALFLLVLILGYWRMVPEVCGAFHDDAIYVITAKALAQGQGYRLIYLPHAPIQTKYPILYPALLAVVWKLWPSFPENLLLMKWLSLLGGAATIGLSYLYFVRFGYFSRSVAGISALVCATSPIFLYFSTQTLSEIPFALLVILALWAFEAQMQEPANQGTRQFFLGVLLALPFLCRTIGVTLLVAALVIQYHRGRTLRWLAFGMGAVILPCVVWMSAGLGSWSREPITGYYTDYVSWWGAMGWVMALRIVWQNLISVLITSATVSLEGLEAILKSINLWGWFFLTYFLGSIPLIVLISKLRTWRLLPFFIISYPLIILLWPWPPYRFLVPILPFLLGYFFEGVSSFFQRWKIRIWYLLPVGLLLVATNLTVLSWYVQDVRKFGYPYIALAQNPAAWASYKDIFAWLKANTQPEDVIASMEDPMIFLYAGRWAIRPFKITPGLLGYGDDLQTYGSPEDLFETLKAYEVRYLVKFPVFAFDQARIDALISQVQTRYPHSLKPVYTGKDKRFVIFELPRPNYQSRRNRFFGRDLRRQIPPG
jgi:hypothetical protein